MLRELFPLSSLRPPFVIQLPDPPGGVLGCCRSRDRTVLLDPSLRTVSRYRICNSSLYTN